MMKDLLEKLIDEAPEGNDGAIDLQIQLGGQMYAGAIKKSDEHPKLFEMIMIGQNSKTAEMTAMRIFMDPKAIQAVFVPMEQSPVYVPKKSSLVIPGMS